MGYPGEHLIPGILGQSLIWISFASVIVSAVFFLPAGNGNVKGLVKQRAAYLFFIFHFMALLGAILTLFYIISRHYFEYAYVWQYSASGAPLKYLISALWAGQEGSFLVWAFFQGILGMVLLLTSQNWKHWVMPVYAIGQVFLLSMLLGIRFLGIQAGNSPFVLLRELAQNTGSELFTDSGYLKMIADGNGLNPLLENFWMTLHPPALFLGYAASFMPFTYAMASLWRKEYRLWLRPCIKWTLVAMITLGSGILLGGRWAYESLTFGGFWSWDPVENASLVPWLILVAALHLMIISERKKRLNTAACFFTLLSWALVVYATYLTRSGILGETSVHSFGDNGQSLQLLIFCLLFFLLPMALLLARRESVPNKAAGNAVSKEFWMLTGAVLMALSAFQVFITTSVPALNKILGTHLAPPADRINYYSTWQLPFALVAGFLISISQYPAYRKTSPQRFLKRFFLSAFVAFSLVLLFILTDHVRRPGYAALMFSMLWAVLASADAMTGHFRKINSAGAAIAHTGFALFITGAVLAFGNPQVISRNVTGVDHDNEQLHGANAILFRDSAQSMGDYRVTYSNRETKDSETSYRIDFKKESGSARGRSVFSAYPTVNRDPQMGAVYNPDTKHFIDKDIFTCIVYAEPPENISDSTEYKLQSVEEIKVKDTLVVSGYSIILDSIHVRMKDEDIENIAITAFFRIKGGVHGELPAVTGYNLVSGELLRKDAAIDALGVKLRFEGVSDKPQTISVGIYEKEKDFIVMKAIIYPFMNLLWAGAFIMVAGLVYTVILRMQRSARLPQSEKAGLTNKQDNRSKNQKDISI